MRYTTDHAAILERLARLACDLRGLNPDHVAAGGTSPAWRRDDIGLAARRAKAVLDGSA